MIPSTAAGLLALLGCVAPGLVFQLRRERYLPQADESVLRETSRMALTSLVFTAASAGLVVWLSTRWTALPDVEEWIRTGQAYISGHYRAVSGFLVLVVSFACLMAAGFEWLTRSEIEGKLTQQSIWWTSFRGDEPESTKRIRLWVTTENGTQFRGSLRHFTTDVNQENRELALGGSTLERLAPNADPVTEWQKLPDYDAVIIPGSDIRHIVVSYLGAEDKPLRLSQRPEPLPWSRRLRVRFKKLSWVQAMRRIRRLLPWLRLTSSQPADSSAQRR